MGNAESDKQAQERQETKMKEQGRNSRCSQRDKDWEGEGCMRELGETK